MENKIQNNAHPEAFNHAIKQMGGSTNVE